MIDHGSEEAIEDGLVCGCDGRVPRCVEVIRVQQAVEESFAYLGDDVSDCMLIVSHSAY